MLPPKMCTLVISLWVLWGAGAACLPLCVKHHFTCTQAKCCSTRWITSPIVDNSSSEDKLSYKNLLPSCLQLSVCLVFPQMLFSLHLCHRLAALNNWGGHILACKEGVAVSPLVHLTWVLKHKRESWPLYELKIVPSKPGGSVTLLSAAEEDQLGVSV